MIAAAACAASTLVVAHTAGARSGGSARLADRSAEAILRRGSLGVRVLGPAGHRAAVSVTLDGTLPRLGHGRRHAPHVSLKTLGAITLDGAGRGSVALRIDGLDRRLLRSSLARCAPIGATVRADGMGIHARRTFPLRLGAGCGRRRSVAAPRTPGGGFSGRTRAGHAARFEVGAAVTDFSPPPAGQAPGGDPADCKAPPTYNGRRLFAFEEPYEDVLGVGHYVGPTDVTNPSGTPFPGDPYMDCNGNGRWDGDLLGGGSDSPRFYDKVADPVTARAIVVSNGKQTIAVEALDQEGLFNVYQQRIRAKVVADGYHLSDMFLSATHDESAPDSLGLGGVTATSSGVNDYFVDYMVDKSALAIEQAYRAMRPATIRYTEAIEPPNVRQCWSSYPYVDDQHMPVLQAVGTNGKTIATLVSVSQHTETLGFNGGTPELDAEKDWVSADWPYWFRTALEQRFGGVGIEMAGAVGSNESPEVYSQPLSRTPQQYIDADHPAGCRTLFDVGSREDVAGKLHVPLGYTGETRAFGQDLANVVIEALRPHSYTPSATNTIWGERANVCIPLDNALFFAAATAGVFANRPGYNSNCSVQFPVAPNGSTTGTNVESQVAAYRIGDAEFISIPGEAFPVTFLRGFVGPADMPEPQYGLPSWPIPHMHTPFRFIDGLAEDMLGYIFPEGNAAGIPSTTNPNPSGIDRFGCEHSDDSESVSAKAGDIIGGALTTLLDRKGWRSEPVVNGRYVMPDGTISRDPLGGPELKCNVDTTFHPNGPAVGIELQDGTVVRPNEWMSLSGLPQTAPDRNTRGYFDASGHRVWLNVFPDLTLP